MEDLKQINELIVERGKATVIEAVSSLNDDDDSNAPGADAGTQQGPLEVCLSSPGGPLDAALCWPGHASLPWPPRSKTLLLKPI
jgi:hypothetical protein